MKKKHTKKRTNYLSNLIFMYKQIYAVSKIRIPLIVLQCIISTANTMLDVLFLKYVIEGLICGRQLKYFIVLVSIKLGALLLMQCCDNVLYNYVYKKIDINIQKNLAIKLFDNIKNVKLEKIEDPEYYDKYQKAISEVSGRVGDLLNYLAYIISTILNIVALVSIISSVNIALILISVVGMLVTVWANIVNTRSVYEANMSFVGVDRKTNYIQRLFYLPQFAQDIRRTKLPELLEQKYQDTISEREQLIKKHWPKIIAIAVSGSWFYNVANIGGGYLYLVIKAIKNVISIGDVTSLTNAINQLSNNLLQISNIIPQGINHSLYIQNYRDMLKETSDGDIYYNMSETEVPHYESINLKNVSFNYTGSNKKAVNDINLKIKKGEHIAIVGENGSGKTTLIKLLCGLYEPSEGEICIGETDFRDISFEKLSRFFGIVDQDFQHYAFTIADNISLQSYENKIDIKGIEKALTAVNMTETISSLKKGIQTIYSKEFDEDGVDFSGGQLQRLAVARAIYSNAEIMVLDEPSSALDPINEKNLYDTIYEICKGKTLIVVSHRLSCVKDVDRILVMNNGKIIESGNFNELMNSGGKFSEMYRIQGERYSI